MSKYIQIYKKNHLKKDDERLGLFQCLNEEFAIEKVFYPGSYAHITPSLIFSYVIYNDMYEKLKSYYSSDEMHTYVNKHKEYKQEPYFTYIQGDYQGKLLLNEQNFDLLISQYAGFISRACKNYLKVGGILIANNSHGDASMASILPEYQLIAIVNKRNNKYFLSTNDLSSYFIPKKELQITEKYLEKIGRGVGYTKSASNYVFRRIT